MDHAPRTPRAEALAPMKGPQRPASIRGGVHGPADGAGQGACRPWTQSDMGFTCSGSCTSSGQQALHGAFGS